MTRDYPNRPIVGVAAVVIEDERVVLVRRGRPPAYGEWSLPGGAVEPGETLEKAVVREVEEEIGLNVEVVEVVAVLDRLFRLSLNTILPKKPERSSVRLTNVSAEALPPSIRSKQSPQSSRKISLMRLCYWISCKKRLDTES